MFGRLFKAWSGKDLLSQAFDEFNTMLEVAEKLFDKVTDVVLCKPGAELPESELIAQDNRINGLERTIRTKILEYLSFEPEGDMPAALVLFSVVKDAERLGDFCKDIAELAAHFPSDQDLGTYREPFLQMESQLENMFSLARRAFLHSDRDLAQEVVRTRAAVKQECKDMLGQVMQDESLGSERAASFALVVYFFKRVGAHLFNIASTVLVPAAQIGHYKPK
jgi:phosphate uptake regulator